MVAEESKVRLDQYISGQIDRSRSFCTNLIKDGLVLVNGKKVKPSYKININDIIIVKIPKEEPLDLKPADIPLNIIYENEYYIIINKQPGLCVHPAPGNKYNTLVNAIINKYQLDDEDELRPGIIHRLDKDTSGLIIVAKNRVVKEKLSHLFKERMVEKKYYALCYGNPKWEHVIVENKIGRHPVDRKKMAVVENGRFAKSEIWVLKRWKDIFLADVKIYTGRTHQIRVHMSHLGFPLIGDTVYGNKLSKKIDFPRQALHSYYLSFQCPFEKRLVSFKIGFPDDMKSFIDKWSINS
ncbi:RluA family pseudouridine synthase [Deferribacter autotrophicus]|uniref:Pseudouridine synthase n=1 Tax=Deferribacter autotrophicus TaxID=500465 RepID=A0A5A8F2A6_9BACT|nr:RluA family pseudouridine synthase [Deferribacter autotrophicus]